MEENKKIVETDNKVTVDGSIISGLSEKYRNQHKIESGEVTLSSERVDEHNNIDYYKTAMEQHEVASMEFDEATADGDLSTTDYYGVKIVMKNIEVNGTPYNPWVRRDYLGIQFDVAVKDIDIENNTVYVSSVLAKEYMGMYTAGILNRELLAALNNLGDGEHLVIPGRVTGIIGNRGNEQAIINLLNSGVKGIISVKDWSKGYVRTLSSVCRIGSCYEFEIIGRDNYKLGKRKRRYFWTCSRKYLAIDPWENEELEHFKKGDIINVTCVNIPVDSVTKKPKSWWWGVSKSVPGIELFCNFSPKVTIVKGTSYQCVIVAVNLKERMFKVTPLKNSPDVIHKIPLFRAAQKTKNDLN